MFKKKKHKTKGREIAPDEIFLDSKNLPGFNRERFEGRIEQPLKNKTTYLVFLAYVFIFAGLLFQAFNLQIIDADQLKQRAQSNYLKTEVIIPGRGVIYDRMGKKLAWNDLVFSVVLDSRAFNPTDENIGRIKELFAFMGINFNQQTFLGRFESALEKDKPLMIGKEYDWNRAENIRLSFPDLPIRVQSVPERHYADLFGLGHVLGFLGYPSEEDVNATLERGEISILENKIGKAGLEKEYENILRGEAGLKLVEVDSSGNIISENTQKTPVSGANITLSIDAELSSKLYKIMRSVAEDRGFSGGAGVIADIRSGDILSLVGYPEYDSNLLSRGGSLRELNQMLSDERKPFFFRPLEGLYPPGSTFKPLIALAALEEKVIGPEDKIFSSGSISLPHPYIAGARSVFYDWKAHGWVDLRRALAVSSNVYFYTVGGGFQEKEGLGANRIAEYARKFGFGQKIDLELDNAAGLVPTPEWKRRYDTDDPSWRIGDTYNLSIGQGYLRATPLQMARFVSLIAKEGESPMFHLINKVSDNKNFSYSPKVTQNNKPFFDIQEENFDIVKEGMRMAVTEGTAKGLSGIGVPVAGKTGTAELGAGDKVDSWFVGFAPYKDPRLVFVFVMEEGDRDNLIGSTYVASQIISWIAQNRAEYIN